jgi:hypothetical protein
LDAIIQVGTGDSSGLFSLLNGEPPNGGQDDFGNHAFSIVSIDWNVVLRESNEWYDRFATAANTADYAERSAALSQLESAVQQRIEESKTPGSLFAGAINRRHRSKLVAGMVLGLFLPALNAATSAEDRANTTLELTRLAAALAVQRAEHGAYPEKLDELVPGVFEKLPVDLYSAKPFFYQRDSDGYLLYSAGENGRDDGGSNQMIRVLKGRDLNDLDAAEAEKLEPTIPAGSDDWSIRVPRPAFEFPKAPPPVIQP